MEGEEIRLNIRKGEEYAAIGREGMKGERKGGEEEDFGTSDTEEYTSSETGSQDTVKFKGGGGAIEVLVEEVGEERGEEEEALYAEIDVKIDRLEEEEPLPPPPSSHEIAQLQSGVGQFYASSPPPPALAPSTPPPLPPPNITPEPEPPLLPPHNANEEFYEEEYSYEPDLQQSSSKVN